LTSGHGSHPPANPNRTVESMKREPKPAAKEYTDFVGTLRITEINHPPYYTRGKIEVWDFILDQRLDYLSGNVVKYLCRAGHKGDRLTDLKKARAYLDKLIESEPPTERKER
jgi:hypothetical protein